MMAKKKVYILITVPCFVICLVILRFWGNNQIVRGFVGDIIITILIYSFIKIFIEIDSLKLAISVLLFSFFVEFMQYLRLIKHLGLEDSNIARIVIGSTFDFRDLLAYTLGILVIYIIDTKGIKYISQSFEK